jgi:hypothetical protein
MHCRIGGAMTPSTSATGGFVTPSTTVLLPRNLTFTQFIQVLLVGISGFPGALVRPEWQINPPKRPDIFENWLAFGTAESIPTINSYLGLNSDGKFVSQRHEEFVVKCAIYGPASLDNYRFIRDGFQIPQNVDAMTAASMGLVEVGKAIHLPELIDERWYDRWDFFISMRYETQRTYPVLTLLSANGTIWAPTATNDNFSVDWLVPAS